MSLIAPWFALAALAALPVAAFYLLRQRPVRRSVANLLLWEALPLRGLEARRWHSIRHWVSLALQLLFLALVVTALIRPTFLGAPNPTQVVYVIDASASMGARDIAGGRFSAAVAAALAEVKGNGGASAVLATGNPPRTLTGWTDEVDEARKALNRIQIEGEAVDPQPTLQMAADLAGPEGRILFFTDRVWQGGEIALPDNVEVRSLGGVAPNAGLTLLAARRSDLDPSAIRLVARVEASGASGGPMRLEIRRDGELADVREFFIEPGGAWTEEWLFDSPGPANFSAKVGGLEGDVLAVDDSASLGIPGLQPLKVKLVSPPDPYIEAALRAVPAVHFEQIWPPEPLGDPDAVFIFRGVTPPENFAARALVLMAPERGGFFGELVGDAGVSEPRTVEDPGGLLRGVDFPWSTVGPVAQFAPTDGARIVVESSGVPLIFADWSATPGWVVLAFDPARGDWVFRAAFPVFISNLLGSFREQTDAPHRATGPSRALTALEPQGAKGAIIPPEGVSELPAFPNFPLPTWLLLAAAMWLLVEWKLYVGRVTQ